MSIPEISVAAVGLIHLDPIDQDLGISEIMMFTPGTEIGLK